MVSRSEAKWDELDSRCQKAREHVQKAIEQLAAILADPDYPEVMKCAYGFRNGVESAWQKLIQVRSDL